MCEPLAKAPVPHTASPMHLLPLLLWSPSRYICAAASCVPVCLMCIVTTGRWKLAGQARNTERKSHQVNKTTVYSASEPEASASSNDKEVNDKRTMSSYQEIEVPKNFPSHRRDNRRTLPRRTGTRREKQGRWESGGQNEEVPDEKFPSSSHSGRTAATAVYPSSYADEKPGGPTAATTAGEERGGIPAAMSPGQLSLRCFTQPGVCGPCAARSASFSAWVNGANVEDEELDAEAGGVGIAAEGMDEGIVIVVGTRGGLIRFSAMRLSHVDDIVAIS
ncbi:hypothetical protein DFH06DRAFT_1132657 [Mycena polygramma]|nr:hypothetical protein DFH06DRAFT_1132657 [Mycena polygramma]